MENNSKQKREFKGMWIPKELYLTTELSWSEKILLAEIDSLNNNGDGCFASNKYFAKFLNLTEQVVANNISKLRKKGLIIDIKFDGRKRYIDVNAALIKMLRQGSQKCEGRVNKNVKADDEKNSPNGAEISQKTDTENTPINTVINTSNNISCKSDDLRDKKSSTLQGRGDVVTDTISPPIPPAPQGTQESGTNIAQEEKISDDSGIVAKSVKTVVSGQILEHGEATVVEEFDLKYELQKMFSPEAQKHIVIIALFIAYSGIKPENKEQLKNIIKRNVRPASELKSYRYERIKEIMLFLKSTADYKWTLETVSKFIDHDLTKLNKNKAYEV
jgi:DNA-binding Lrp family transcriptional regulator